MDRLDALVAIAHMRLRLEVLQRNPEFLDMLKIKKPIELAGLKSRMMRAESQEKAIGDLGKRYDGIQDGIDELVAAHSEHVGELEHYESDLRRKIEGMVGSNGGDPLSDGQDGQESAGQIISSETPKS